MFQFLSFYLTYILNYSLFFCVLFIHSKTPITLEDGENFGKGEKFFHFACFDKRKSEPTVILT